MNNGAEKPAGLGDVMTNVLGLIVITAFVAIGLAYAIDALNRRAGTDRGTDVPVAMVPVNVSGVALSVPAPWLKYPEQLESAFADRLDLSVTLELGSEPVSVTLTLLPKTRVRSSAALIDSVYLQHFTGDERRGAPGLIGKPLTGGEGYDGETVWYDPIRFNPFVAKCAPPLDAEKSGSCLRTLILDSGLAVIVDFPDTALKDWREFNAPLASTLTSVGAGALVG